MPESRYAQNVRGRAGRRTSGDQQCWACPVRSGLSRCRRLVLVVGFCLATGCSAITFPAGGIPVYRLPEELLSPPKDDMHSINLALLKQPAPTEYLLAPGDVLGVWVAGVMGSAELGPPIQAGAADDSGPSSGIPIRVRSDGTIHLPLIDPIPVQGKSLDQAEEGIRDAYLKSGVITPGLERILISLIKQRKYTVLVVRQELGVANAPRQSNRFAPQQLSRAKRGTGHRVELPAYQNDVLTALTETGGFPGLDAYNEIIIYRGAIGPGDNCEAALARWEDEGPRPPVYPAPPPGMPERLPSPQSAEPLPLAAGGITRIPLRLPLGEPLPISPSDVILQSGDVVYIEARDPEVFYTGGLMPTGEWPLPRDYDLDVMEAIALIQGPLFSGGLQTNNFLLAQQLISGEMGGPSPSLALVIRRTADGGQVPIRVDLNRALTDASERIVIHPGDFIILQQTTEEALARYVTGIFRFDLHWRIFSRGDAVGIGDVRFPESLPQAFTPIP